MSELSGKQLEFVNIRAKWAKIVATALLEDILNDQPLEDEERERIIVELAQSLEQKAKIPNLEIKVASDTKSFQLIVPTGVNVEIEYSEVESMLLSVPLPEENPDLTPEIKLKIIEGIKAQNKAFIFKNLKIFLPSGEFCQNPDDPRCQPLQ